MYITAGINFLDSFAKLQKAIISLFMFDRLAVRM